MASNPTSPASSAAVRESLVEVMVPLQPLPSPRMEPKMTVAPLEVLTLVKF